MDAARDIGRACPCGAAGVRSERTFTSGPAAPMDQYRRIDAPKEQDSIEDHEIRVMHQGKVRRYISYATNMLTVRRAAAAAASRVSTPTVDHMRLKPMYSRGSGGEGAAGRAEGHGAGHQQDGDCGGDHQAAHRRPPPGAPGAAPRRPQGLDGDRPPAALHFQITDLSSTEVVDIYEPIVEGLDRCDAAFRRACAPP